MSTCFEIYVRTQNVYAVVSALDAILEAEGMLRVSAPIWQPRNANPDECNTWAVACYPAADEWSAITTTPYNLLVEQRTTSRSRLLNLCDRLGCEGFFLFFTSNGQEALIETDGSGRTAASGWVWDDNNERSHSYLGVDLNSGGECQFHVLNGLQHHIDRGLREDIDICADSDRERSLLYLLCMMQGTDEYLSLNSDLEDALKNRPSVIEHNALVMHFQWQGPNREIGASSSTTFAPSLYADGSPAIAGDIVSTIGGACGMVTEIKTIGMVGVGQRSQVELVDIHSGERTISLTQKLRLLARKP